MFCGGWRFLVAGALVAAGAAVPAAAQNGRYQIQAYDVLGVSVLPAADIERAVYPFAGPERSDEDIEKARAAVQAVYAARGYEAVIVELPPQDPELLAQGVITIRVNEVPVSRVRVTESKYHSLTGVREDVPSVQVGQPLNLRALQKDLEAANRYPDREITPSFRPGLIPGTVEVELRVRSRRPFHGSVEVNDDTSPNTEDLRVAASLRYSDLWSLGHTIALNYVVAPENRQQQEVIAGSYSAPLIGTPWTILVSGFRSNSNVAALGGTNVLGNGYQVGIRGIYRLPSSLFQTLSFGVDWKDFNQDIRIGGAVASTAPVRYLPLTVEYAVAKETESTSFDATASASMGLRVVKRTLCFDAGPGLPCIPDDQFTNRAANSRENFFRFNLLANFQAATKSDWVGAVRFSAQISDSPLVTNEQYAVGGLTSVRGYFVSEAVGDDGVNFGFEGRAPSFASLIGGPLDELRVFGFVDVGYVRVRQPQPEQASHFTLFSGGAGVRLRLFDAITGEALVAVPMTDGPLTGAGKPRFTFSARGQF